MPTNVAEATTIGLDGTFGDKGWIHFGLPGGNDQIISAGILSGTAKVIVVGNLTWYDGDRIFLARYNTNGTLDATFGQSGFVTFRPPDAQAVSVTAAYIDAGHITLVATETPTLYSPWQATGLAVRYLLDGTLDTTFCGRGWCYFGPTQASNPVAVSVTSGVTSIAVSCQGNGVALARLLADGSADPSLPPTGSPCVAPADVYPGITVATIDDSGSVYFAALSSDAFLHIFRLTPQGSLDVQFAPTGQRQVAWEYGVPPAITHVGTSAIVAGGVSGIRAVKIQSNGTLDQSFGAAGTANLVTPTNFTVSALVPCGSAFCIAGSAGSSYGSVIGRITGAGAWDTTFNTTGYRFTLISTAGSSYVGPLESATYVVPTSSGMYMVGYAQDANTGVDSVVARYSNAGAPISSFGINGIVVSDYGKRVLYQVDVFLPLSNGTFIVGGEVQAPQGTFSLLARVLPSGMLDDTFAGNGYVQESCDQPNALTWSGLVYDGVGYVAAANCANPYSSTPYPSVVFRLNANGSADNTFGVAGRHTLAATLADVAISDMLVRADRSVVLAGISTSGAAVVGLTAQGGDDVAFGASGTLRIPMATVFSDAKITSTDRGFAVASSSGDYLIVTGVTNAGVVDSGFGLAGTSTAPVDSAQVFGASISQSKVLVGTESCCNGPPLFVRMSTAGILDLSFGSGGVAPPYPATPWDNDTVKDMDTVSSTFLVQDYGTSVVARIDGSANLDVTFNGDGYVTVDDPFQPTDSAKVRVSDTIYLAAPSAIARFAPAAVPPAPSSPVLSSASDSGPSSSDGYTNVANPFLVGTCPTDSIVWLQYPYYNPIPTPCVNGHYTTQFPGSAFGTSTQTVTATAERYLVRSDASPSYSFTIDTNAPVLSFVTVPAGNQSGPNFTFVLGASEDNVQFRCALDQAPFAACGPSVALAGLTTGPHVLTATATDLAGNVSTPVAYYWNVGSVSALTLLASSSPIVINYPIQLMARFPDATVTGTVKFLAGGAAIAACVAVPIVAVANASQATCTTAFTTEGTQDLVAFYAGDVNHPATSSYAEIDVFGAACAGFADVSQDSSFCASVQWIKEREITLGCADGTLFCPNDPVSRIAMAAFMTRLGNDLEPLLLDASESIGSIDLDEETFACKIGPLAPNLFAGDPIFDLSALVSGQGTADATFNMSIVASSDGIYWYQVAAPDPLLAKVMSGQWSSTREIAQTWYYGAAPWSFAIRISRDSMPGTGDIQGAQCQLHLNVFDSGTL